jgi:protein-L-isoaspartate(D-aspartate) O-methyltransferase
MTDPRAIQLLMSLRRQGIHDNKVLGVIERTPREVFVDEPFAHQAWDNSALPIACGQTISQPYVVAYITQELKLDRTMRVLELGTGSGYQAAVLAPLCRRVYTVERHRPLLKQAEARFKQLKLHNVATKHADGLNGWREQAPFDRIVLSAAVAEVPLILIEQLKPGGALIAPVGSVPKSNDFGVSESVSQHLTRIIRTEAGYEQEMLLPVLFVPMVSGVPQEVKAPNDRADKKF